MMKQNILLPVVVLADVCRLIHALDVVELDVRAKALCVSLQSQIEAKLNAMDRHDSFTKYKTADSGSPEREFYRREYLDKARIHRDWISDEEMHFSP